MQLVKAKANQIAMLKAQVESQRRMVEASIRDINTQKLQFRVQLRKTKI